MPRNTAVVIENSFVKGLITEATGLNFPENACTETSNCIFQHTGEVSRRLGIDYEHNFVANNITTTGNAIKEFLWKAVAQNGEFTFEVVQVGNILSFYAVGTSSISGALKSFTVDLNSFKASGAPSLNDIGCSFDSGHGYLFVSHPYCNPFYVAYDSDAQTISTAQVDVRVRDFEGLVDNLGDDTRPLSLSKEHHYNLLNQGWYVDTALTSDLKTWKQGSPLEYWRNTSTAYPRIVDFPSNSDVWWYYKSIMKPHLDSSGNVTAPTPLEAFSMVEAQNVDKSGTTLAPKGHYTFTAWNIDRASVSYSSDDHQTGLSGIPVVSSGYQRPSQIAFYSSRVWYAGINANFFNTKIYFSNIIEKVDDFGRCYQKNDPSSEKAADLLPSDGGVIVIPDISTIVKLKQVGNALFIFATNGTWKIEGGQSIGFAANDYSISKVSTIGAISDTSFVDVEGVPMWWNNDGIWGVSSDPSGTAARVESLSFGTVQSFVDAIDNSNKRYVKGAYNPLEKVVQWLYRTTNVEAVEERYQYDGILNLSMINQSFYPWALTSSTNKIVGICVVQGAGSNSAEVAVLDNSGNIVTTGAGNVTVLGSTSSDLNTIFKYLVTPNSTKLTFAEFDGDSYKDWVTVGENADFPSYFITGYKIHGDAIRKFQSNYTQIYTRNEIPSVFDFQSRWDYATFGDTGRWSNVQRVTMDDTRYGFRTKRLKNRGHGKVMQYKVTSVDGQPFNLIGWSTLESGNTSA